MKKYSFLIVSILFLFAFVACEDEDPTAVINQNVVESTLQALPSTDYVLLEENETEIFGAFNWTATEYGVTTPVTYTLELDTAGNEFANPKEFLTVIDELTDTFTVKEFNTAVLSYGFKPALEVSIEIRVGATIGADYETVYSEPISLNVTTFNAFDPIYMIGPAVSDWDPGQAVEVTGIAANLYETTTEFTNGGHFRFFSEPSWDAEQWGYDYFTGDVTELLAPETSHEDPNYRFDGDTGNYRITVDLEAKSISMVLVN
ncbi:MAG: SusE domain-containing protein [Bacteroidetes bacterium]|nr:SusE domain-containing protein [Bacteroidota bacterium]